MATDDRASRRIAWLARAGGLWLATCAPNRAHRSSARRSLGVRFARVSDGARESGPIYRCRGSASAARGRVTLPRRDSRQSCRTSADPKKRCVVAFMAHFDIDGALFRGVSFIVHESFKGRNSNQSIAPNFQRRGRVWDRVSNRPGTFGKYPCVSRTPLDLHGGTVAVLASAVLSIGLTQSREANPQF